MLCLPENGLRFSFNCKDTQQDPGSETPRFQDAHLNIPRSNTAQVLKYNNQSRASMTNAFRFSFQRQEKQPSKNGSGDKRSEKGRMNRSVCKLQLEEGNPTRQEQNRSVRSVQSLKERLAERSTNKKMIQIKKKILTNKTRSLSSLLQQRISSPFKQAIQSNKKDIATKLCLQGIFNQTPRRSVPKHQLYTNKQGQQECLFTSQTKKQTGSQTPLKQPGSQGPQKSPSLKSPGKQGKQRSSQGRKFKVMLHRAKPVVQLQLQAGTRSNDKIENISRAFQEFRQE